MRLSKYGNFLTALLVTLIIIIVVVVGLLIYNYVIKPRIQEKETQEAIAEFDRNIESEKKDAEDEQLTNTIKPTEEATGSSKKEKVYYKGFVMLGYITIPKTNVKEPILDSVTPDSLNAAVAALYPSNPQLNQAGNIVIVGHNYRNGKFFSDNNKLSVGDKIMIKDNSGKELTYTIYKKFQTTETDTSFYTRDTNGKAEITLSTCTDDSKARIIILAREN